MSIGRSASVAFALFALVAVVNGQNPITGPLDAPRKARIKGAQAELSNCDADKNCYTGPLFQARLNALLKIDKTVGDFEESTIPGVAKFGSGAYSKLVVTAPAILTEPVDKEPLRGKMAMSVYVSAYGDTGIPAAEMRLSFEQQLHALGITVLRHGDPPNFPVLNLVVREERPDEKTVTYTCNIELRQLAPGTTAATRPINDVAIWKLSTPKKAVATAFAWNSTDDALQLAAVFARAWRDVNGYHKPTSENPMPAVSLGSSSSEPGPPLHRSQTCSTKDGKKDGGCVDVVGLAFVGNIYDVPEIQRAMVQKELKDLQTTGHLLITCEYGPTHPETGLGFFVYRFWYKSAPVNILQLLTSAYSHPVLDLGRVFVEACPATNAQADNVYRKRMS
jgi:hypothetical protein